MSRCQAGIDNCGHLGGGIMITGLSGDYYDRCRRVAGHVDGSWLGQWHLPDCGGAFNDDEEWRDDWFPIYELVAATRREGLQRVYGYSRGAEQS